jgi:hypothetical protein
MKKNYPSNEWTNEGMKSKKFKEVEDLKSSFSLEWNIDIIIHYYTREDLIKKLLKKFY